MKEENTSIWPTVKMILLVLVAVLFFIVGIVLAGTGLLTFILVGPTTPHCWKIYAPCFALSAVCFVLGRFILRLSKNTSAAKEAETRNQMEREWGKGSSETKRKKSQLIGYILCWICAPIFFFFAAFCDREDYCETIGVLALLFLFSAIPLIIGQVVLYRSKRTFPPLDALFFLAAALCDLTILLLHVGMILWGVGLLMEVILLLYVMTCTITQKIRKAPVDTQIEEKK